MKQWMKQWGGDIEASLSGNAAQRLQQLFASMSKLLMACVHLRGSDERPFRHDFPSGSSGRACGCMQGRLCERWLFCIAWFGQQWMCVMTRDLSSAHDHAQTHRGLPACAHPHLALAAENFN